MVESLLTILSRSLGAVSLTLGDRNIQALRAVSSRSEAQGRSFCAAASDLAGDWKTLHSLLSTLQAGPTFDIAAPCNLQNSHPRNPQSSYRNKHKLISQGFTKAWIFHWATFIGILECMGSKGSPVGHTLGRRENARFISTCHIQMETYLRHCVRGTVYIYVLAPVYVWKKMLCSPNQLHGFYLSPLFAQ